MEEGFDLGLENHKAIILSGIGPGPTGVGRFVDCLSRIYGRQVEFIWIKANKSIRSLVAQRRYTSVTFEILGRLVSRFAFRVSTFLLKNRRIIIIHPQSIGLSNIQRLAKKNSVEFLLVDNFWFCRRSYNYFAGACFSCINSIDQEKVKNCKTRPVPYSARTYERFYDFFQNSSFQIYTQTESQAELLRTHQPRCSVSKIGLLSDELSAEDKQLCPMKKSGEKINSIFFHAALIDEKGFSWAISLAELCPEIHFTFPGQKPENLTVSKNVSFESLTWESGLKTRMQDHDVVLCPSLWSYVIEGAVMKSIWYHGRVAIVATAGSWANELPEDVCLILPIDLKQAADHLKDPSKQLPSPIKARAFLSSIQKQTRKAYDSVLLG